MHSFSHPAHPFRACVQSPGCGDGVKPNPQLRKVPAQSLSLLGKLKSREPLGDDEQLQRVGLVVLVNSLIQTHGGQGKIISEPANHPDCTDGPLDCIRALPALLCLQGSRAQG